MNKGFGFSNFRCLVAVICLKIILIAEHVTTLEGKSQCNNFRNASEYYIGGVVEYKPDGTPWDSSPDELLQKNCDNYIEIIKDAASQNVDIVVFPEYGLTTIGMPFDREKAKPYLQIVPEVGYNPCDQGSTNDTVIRRLACASKSSQIYVVINLGEIEPCDGNQSLETNTCPADGVHQYSTNVAFDRNGTIIAKYHKQVIFFENQYESPAQPEIVIFNTDFGVEFGLITSYDIVFFSPAVQLVAQGVKNIIFPNVWYDQLPFLSALQASAMWASGAKVNLLASGYHQPPSGQLGSGIFSGTSGVLNYTHDQESETKLVVANIPKFPEIRKVYEDLPGIIPHNPKTDHSFIREDLENYTTTILNFTDGSNVYQSVVCNNGLCCSLNYIPGENIPITSQINYRLVVFNGTRKIAQGTSFFAWQVCGVLRCLNSTLASCTDNTDEEFSGFKFLELSGGPFHTNQIIQPAMNLLDIYFNVIPYNFFEFTSLKNDSVKISSNKLETTFVQTIAIIGRIYLNS